MGSRDEIGSVIEEVMGGGKREPLGPLARGEMSASVGEGKMLIRP